MGKTLFEKILDKHSSSNKKENFIYAKVDFCFGNDITAPLAIKEFRKAGFKRVFNPKRISFICDHFLPARDYTAANNVKILKNFADEYKIKNFFDIDRAGIEHIFLLEKGLIKPGYLVVGADSHTCTLGAIGCVALGVGSTDFACVMKEGKVWLRRPGIVKFVYKGKLGKWLSGKDLILYTIGKIGADGALYKVMEFTGPIIRKLSMDDRFVMCNMAVEAGAKTGIIEVDEKTVQYLQNTTGWKGKFNQEAFSSDKDAEYEEVVEMDVSNLSPQVACPHLPANVKPVEELRKVKVNQIVIGSCTNGRLSDLKQVARILKGKKVAKKVRVLVIPATYNIYKQAEKEGVLEVLVEAGCVVAPPTCGPCLGGHMGILDKGEVCLATTNRNFQGRMGHPGSYLYLSSPAVAAASALTGRITHPQQVH